MDTTEHGWTVIDRDAAVLVHTYRFDFLPGEANSLVVRIGDGQLLLLGAPLDPSPGLFADLEPFGTVAAILAPNGFHYAGIPAWKARYPDAPVFGPELAVERIPAKLPAAGPVQDVEGLLDRLPPHVTVLDVPSTKGGELMVFVDLAQGRVLYGSHLVTNLAAAPNFMVKLVWGLTRSGPGFVVNRMAAWVSFSDKARVKQYVLDQLQDRPATVFVPPHGAVVAGPDVTDRLTALVEGW